ncbi:MAG: twin-arginine translocation signal domain-containing protein, partial [bacterium]|nr:twin-arginine translocation signal domain-containing protein [bacterium]
MSDTEEKKTLTRRDFVKKGVTYGASAAGLLGLAATPLLKRDTGDSFTDIFQKHYMKLTPEELDKVLKRIE